MKATLYYYFPMARLCYVPALFQAPRARTDFYAWPTMFVTKPERVALVEEFFQQRLPNTYWHEASNLIELFANMRGRRERLTTSDKQKLRRQTQVSLQPCYRGHHVTFVFFEHGIGCETKQYACLVNEANQIWLLRFRCLPQTYKGTIIDGWLCYDDSEQQWHILLSELLMAYYDRELLGWTRTKSLYVHPKTHDRATRTKMLEEWVMLNNQLSESPATPWHPFTSLSVVPCAQVRLFQRKRHRQDKSRSDECCNSQHKPPRPWPTLCNGYEVYNHRSLWPAYYSSRRYFLPSHETLLFRMSPNQSHAYFVHLECLNDEGNDVKNYAGLYIAPNILQSQGYHSALEFKYGMIECRLVKTVNDEWRKELPKEWDLVIAPFWKHPNQTLLAKCRHLRWQYVQIWPDFVHPSRPATYHEIECYMNASLATAVDKHEFSSHFLL